MAFAALDAIAAGEAAEWHAFKRGVADALPLFVEDGANFSLAQIASAISRDISYLRAEVARGKLAALRSGKIWYVTPEDFAAWYKSKKWKNRG